MVWSPKKNTMHLVLGQNPLLGLNQLFGSELRDFQCMYIFLVCMCTAKRYVKGPLVNAMILHVKLQ